MPIINAGVLEGALQTENIYWSRIYYNKKVTNVKEIIHHNIVYDPHTFNIKIPTLVIRQCVWVHLKTVKLIILHSLKTSINSLTYKVTNNQSQQYQPQQFYTTTTKDSNIINIDTMVDVMNKHSFYFCYESHC